MDLAVTTTDTKRKRSSRVIPAAKRQKASAGDTASDNDSTQSPYEQSETRSLSPPTQASAESTAATTTEPSTPTTKNPARDKKYICDFPDCGKAFVRPVRLAEHQRSHTGERPFVCTHDDCDKAFLRESHLKAHVKTAHEDKRDWICAWKGCGQAFATGQRFRKHVERHEKKEECKCTGFPPCEQYFRKQETLQRHIVSVHMQDKPYVCDHVDGQTGVVCGRKYKQSLDLMRHRDREHSGNRFWCHLCLPDSTAMEIEAIEFGSPASAVGYPTYGELQNHIKTAHPPICSECGHVCSTQSQLRAHIDIHHGTVDERRTFKCHYEGCERGFTKKGNLDVHIRSVHEKQKKFVCGEFDLSTSDAVPGWDADSGCGRALGSKIALEGHVRTHHLGLPQLKNGPKHRSNQTRQEAASDNSEQQSALDLLTGTGYEKGRHLSCTIVPCPYRFMRVYDLEVHLESAHGFTALAAMEAAVEQQALSGGQFWIGGSEDEDEEDILLAQKLNQALSAENGGRAVP